MDSDGSGGSGWVIGVVVGVLALLFLGGLGPIISLVLPPDKSTTLTREVVVPANSSLPAKVEFKLPNVGENGSYTIYLEGPAEENRQLFDPDTDTPFGFVDLGCCGITDQILIENCTPNEWNALVRIDVEAPNAQDYLDQVSVDDLTIYPGEALATCE